MICVVNIHTKKCGNKKNRQNEMYKYIYIYMYMSIYICEKKQLKISAFLYFFSVHLHAES